MPGKKYKLMYPRLSKDEYTELGKDIIDEIDKDNPFGMRYIIIKQKILDLASKYFALPVLEHPGF